ncbi:MAG TPA: ribonucleoside-diphosphate reductase subunit alpha [Actinocrinis sp.]|nr:ribonucleoside-diphosphate reductase subunit alpha [Actinocrinis sp.]
MSSSSTGIAGVRESAPAVEIADVVRLADLPGADGADLELVLARVRASLPERATAAEAADLAVRTAAELIGQDPAYSKLAARLLAERITAEVAGACGTETAVFSASIALGSELGLIGEATADLVAAHAAQFDREVAGALAAGADHRFEYFGLRTVYDRYLLRHPETRAVIETPQFFLLRVACGLARTPAEAVEFYRLTSSLAYLPSSPTLFNAGTRHPQLSSCFLLDSPPDDLGSIFDAYGQIAQLSKFSGGIGVSWSRVRSRGALIRSTNGKSNGIVPWLRILDASVAAVNQGGRRKGACCAYLEPWHADVEEFLELRDNTGEEARRTHNLNLANWIPDEFMRRVEADGVWSLFDPDQVPELPDLWGERFDEAYRRAEAEGRYTKQVKARDLYGAMMRTLATTGNGWMTFKDAANRSCNQTARPENTVHLSNLCTEILEVTTAQESAVCNLGSINLGAHVAADGAGMDWPKLRATIRTALPFLDRVIDLTYYPTEQTAGGNPRWRPVGLGLMGLQDVFFALRLPFDSAEALALSTRISEEIYLTALEVSADLAVEYGPHPAFAETRVAGGTLHQDHFAGASAAPELAERWTALRAKIARTGVRNSLLIAIAPTATIASIAGCCECIEPQVSNLFKRETLSGEFLQINNALVTELKQRGLWTGRIRDRIKQAEGSVQSLTELPEDVRTLFRTAWELPQRALIDLAAARTPYVDQSQSLNLFMAAPTLGKVSSMYLYAWKAGLKTTYYLRSRPATRIQQATVGVPAQAPSPVVSPVSAVPAVSSVAPGAADDEEYYDESAIIACSLENPESCEACQ